MGGSRDVWQARYLSAHHATSTGAPAQAFLTLFYLQILRRGGILFSFHATDRHRVFSFVFHFIVGCCYFLSPHSLQSSASIVDFSPAAVEVPSFIIAQEHQLCSPFLTSCCRGPSLHSPKVSLHSSISAPRRSREAPALSAFRFLYYIHHIFLRQTFS